MGEIDHKFSQAVEMYMENEIICIYRERHLVVYIVGRAMILIVPSPCSHAKVLDSQVHQHNLADSDTTKSQVN